MAMPAVAAVSAQDPGPQVQGATDPAERAGPDAAARVSEDDAAASCVQVAPDTPAVADAPAAADDVPSQLDSGAAPEQALVQKKKHTLRGLPAWSTADEAETSAQEADLVTVVPGLSGPRRAHRWMLALAAAVCAVLGAAGYGLWSWWQMPKLSGKVVYSPHGPVLALKLRGGDHVRSVALGTVQAPVDAQAATLPLSDTQLNVGRNALTVGLLMADGSTVQMPLQVHMDIHLQPRLAALARRAPRLDIEVRTVPRARVSINGRPLQVDGRGRARYQEDLADRIPRAGDAESLARALRPVRLGYRVERPDGRRSEGSLKVRLHASAGRLDWSGGTLITDRTAVQLTGVAGEGSRVLADGQPLPLKQGRFRYPMRLPQLGTYRPEVLVLQPGRLPLRLVIEVQRVTDLQKAAANFAADPDVDYPRLARQSQAVRGAAVALRGRLYHRQARAGGVELQVLVEPCAKARCPLWVSSPAWTDAAVGSDVRIFGRAAGRQQFRASSGKVTSVPKLDAQIVLPALR